MILIKYLQRNSISALNYRCRVDVSLNKNQKISGQINVYDIHLFVCYQVFLFNTNNLHKYF